MQVYPRLQLIAPYQVKLLKDLTVGLDSFKKGDVVTMEEFHAKKLIEAGSVETVKEEGVESVNRWEQTKATGGKKQDALNAALAEAGKDPASDVAKTSTTKTDEALVAADADKAGTSTRVTRNNPQ